MSLITLDPEHEYEEVTSNLGGVFIDMMAGRYIINVLEPKQWSEDIEDSGEDDVPVAFKQSTVLAQHISFYRRANRYVRNYVGKGLSKIQH